MTREQIEKLVEEANRRANPSYDREDKDTWLFVVRIIDTGAEDERGEPVYAKMVGLSEDTIAFDEGYLARLMGVEVEE